jgi:hypothetical protein
MAEKTRAARSTRGLDGSAREKLCCPEAKAGVLGCGRERVQIRNRMVGFVSDHSNRLSTCTGLRAGNHGIEDFV